MAWGEMTHLLLGCQLKTPDVISSVFSFLSRQVGIKNGMFFGYAKQLCPNLQAVPYDFHACREVAQAMYETLARYCAQHAQVHPLCSAALVALITHCESLAFVPPVLLPSACRFDRCLCCKCSFSNWEFSFRKSLHYVIVQVLLHIVRSTGLCEPGFLSPEAD